MKHTFGFIGLGKIGLPMAERLLERGLPLVVWNRSADKAEALVSRGAQRGLTPREVAAASDVVITMLTDGPALEEVSFSPEGIGAGLAAGRVHCDMSTIDPATTARIAAAYAQRGIQFVHAPVLGSGRAAASGALLIFAGGPQEALEKCEPALAALGRRIWRWDDPQRAACVKLACNLLLAGMMELLAESLVLVAKAGVEPRALLEILGASALAAPMYQTKGEIILQRNFVPSFYMRNMRKDLDLILESGKRLGVALPTTRAVRDVFSAAMQAGRAEQDYSAVIEWLEEQSGLRAVNR